MKSGDEEFDWVELSKIKNHPSRRLCQWVRNETNEKGGDRTLKVKSVEGLLRGDDTQL